MIHAYDKVYLEKARIVLGRMLDFAVYNLHYEIGDFYTLFLSSPSAGQFETGDYSVLAGQSGVELAYQVLEQTGTAYERISPDYTANRSAEYWAGWALAYYQWETAMHFAEIDRVISIRDIVAMYNPYHEMDIRQFVDHMNNLYAAARPETNLKLRRQLLGLSQRELADRTGIPVRTIQQYEQRQKNINKAQAEYLVALSKSLCCQVEDLMEKCEG